MKSQLLLSTIATLAIGVAPFAAFADDEGVSVGIVTGDTNGITLKVPTFGTSSVDISAGVDFDASLNGSDARIRADLNEARLRADWQQPFAVIQNPSLHVPFYVGLGGFLQPDALGVRAPLGMAFQLQDTPLEIFAQTGLEAILLDSNSSEPSLGVSGALGLRITGINK
jgi:hypothetical protein